MHCDVGNIWTCSKLYYVFSGGQLSMSVMEKQSPGGVITGHMWTAIFDLSKIGQCGIKVVVSWAQILTIKLFHKLILYTG